MPSQSCNNSLIWPLSCLGWHVRAPKLSTQEFYTGEKKVSLRLNSNKQQKWNFGSCIWFARPYIPVDHEVRLFSLILEFLLKSAYKNVSHQLSRGKEKWCKWILCQFEKQRNKYNILNIFNRAWTEYIHVVCVELQ